MRKAELWLSEAPLEPPSQQAYTYQGRISNPRGFCFRTSSPDPIHTIFHHFLAPRRMNGKGKQGIPGDELCWSFSDWRRGHVSNTLVSQREIPSTRSADQAWGDLTGIGFDQISEGSSSDWQKAGILMKHHTRRGLCVSPSQAGSAKKPQFIQHPHATPAGFNLPNYFGTGKTALGPNSHSSRGWRASPRRALHPSVWVPPTPCVLHPAFLLL